MPEGNLWQVVTLGAALAISTVGATAYLDRVAMDLHQQQVASDEKIRTELLSRIDRIEDMLHKRLDQVEARLLAEHVTREPWPNSPTSPRQ